MQDTAQDSIKTFIYDIPKAETHVHVQGCVTPELMLKFAERNQIPLQYQSPDEVKAYIATCSSDLAAFIQVLNEVSSVLRTEEDYYETALDYLFRSAQQNVKFAEMQFDPQPAIENGLSLGAVLSGLNAARQKAREEYQIDCHWIMSFNRDRSPESAMEILSMAETEQENVVAVGLDHQDTPGYTNRFKTVFDRAAEMGFKRTTHVDLYEDNAAERVWGAIKDLQVDGRIDHGIDGLADMKFCQHMSRSGLALAVTPTLFFNEDPEISTYFKDVCGAVRYMLDHDLNVTISTDDPGIFGMNYESDTLCLVQRFLELTKEEIVRLAKNSFDMLWLDEAQKSRFQDMLVPFEQSARKLTT